jgi:hypothetical protein
MPFVLATLLAEMTTTTSDTAAYLGFAFIVLMFAAIAICALGWARSSAGRVRMQDERDAWRHSYEALRQWAEEVRSSKTPPTP